MVATEGIVTGESKKQHRLLGKKYFKIATLSLLLIVLIGSLAGGVYYWSGRDDRRNKKYQEALNNSPIIQLNKADIKTNIEKYKDRLLTAKTDTERVFILINYATLLRDNGDNQKALQVLTDIESTYPIDVINKSNIDGVYWGIYENLNDKAKAEYYKKRYIVYLRDNNQNDLADQLEKSSGGN